MSNGLIRLDFHVISEDDDVFLGFQNSYLEQCICGVLLFDKLPKSLRSWISYKYNILL